MEKASDCDTCRGEKSLFTRRVDHNICVIAGEFFRSTFYVQRCQQVYLQCGQCPVNLISSKIKSYLVKFFTGDLPDKSGHLVIRCVGVGLHTINRGSFKQRLTNGFKFLLSESPVLFIWPIESPNSQPRKLKSRYYGCYASNQLDEEASDRTLYGQLFRAR